MHVGRTPSRAAWWGRVCGLGSGHTEKDGKGHRKEHYGKDDIKHWVIVIFHFVYYPNAIAGRVRATSLGSQFSRGFRSVAIDFHWVTAIVLFRACPRCV